VKVAYAQGNSQRAQELLNEAQLVQGRNKHRNLGELFLDLCDYAAARRCFEEELALQRTGQNTGRVGAALLQVGFVAWRLGDGVTTQCHAVEALGLFQVLEHLGGTFAALESLSAAALAQERNERAVRLMGAVEGLRETLGLPDSPHWWGQRRKPIEEAICVVTHDPAFRAAWAEGRAMTLEQVVEYALEVDEESHV
jgi:hypothetical protein